MCPVLAACMVLLQNKLGRNGGKVQCIPVTRRDLRKIVTIFNSRAEPRCIIVGYEGIAQKLYWEFY